jgi:inorganic pyrophosphatase
VKVFIENPAGSLIKHIHDEKTLELKATTPVSRAYPLPYGFVLHTTAEDGDNVDCFLLTRRPLDRGVIVDCEPIGLMEQVEDGDVDHKILAAIHNEPVALSDEIRHSLLEFTSHVFDHVPGKVMVVGGFRDKAAAVAYVRQHQDSDAL